MKGLTQSDLGLRIGQPQSAVSRIERGGDLRVSTLLEMARALGMEPMLIPKHLVPAVGALVGHTNRENAIHASDGTVPLVGGTPEDAEDSE